MKISRKTLVSLLLTFSASLFFNLSLFVSSASPTLEGEKDRYLLTKSRMPLVYKATETFGKTSEMKVLIGLPLTFETLSVVDSMRKTYKNITVIPQSSGEHSSLQKGVFAYLEKWGIPYYTQATEETRIKALKKKPDIIVDCSFMLGEVAVKHGLFDEDTILIEDTKTGENRLDAFAKSYPTFKKYIVLDNSSFKRLYENRIGIGYSVAGALLSLGFYLPNYTVGVVGYGYVGSGFAKFSRDLGAHKVLVSEPNPDRAAIARKNGFTTLTTQELLKKSDIVITATGVSDVINKRDLKSLNKRIVLGNAGGEQEWVREDMFRGLSGRKIHEDIEVFKVGTSEVWELGSGNSLNLVKQISVTEFLDITFSQLIYIVNELQNRALPDGKTSIEAFESKLFKSWVEKKYGPAVNIFRQ